MSETIARIMTRLNPACAETTDEDISAYSSFWSVECPADLREFWRTYGSVEGFAGASHEGEYLVLQSPRELINDTGMKEVRADMPDGFSMIGSNGGGELIVLAAGKGYGLLPAIHGGASDFHFLAATLDEFFAVSEQGKWFV